LAVAAAAVVLVVTGVCLVVLREPSVVAFDGIPARLDDLGFTCRSQPSGMYPQPICTSGGNRIEFDATPHWKAQGDPVTPDSFYCTDGLARIFVSPDLGWAGFVWSSPDQDLVSRVIRDLNADLPCDG
jgi:hypothetical protein